MFDMFQIGNFGAASGASINQGGPLVFAVPLQRRNGSLQQVPGAETQKSVESLALANAASFILWTSAAGNVIYLVHLSVSTSVAGKVSMLYNGIVFWQAQLPAASVISVQIGGMGMYLYPAASNLLVRNDTGGASDLRANAFGAEVVA